MTVIVPADATETQKVIRAVANFKGPAYVRLSRLATPVVYENENFNYEIGKGIVAHEGHDLTIIACGIMVAEAIEAAKELLKTGISARVIDLHTIKPIDKELIIKAAKETKCIITAEEHSILGGLGGAVAEVLSENCPVPLIRIGMQDTFGESGKPEDLLKKYGLTSGEIVKTAKIIILRKK
jgi:transketolase